MALEDRAIFGFDVGFNPLIIQFFIVMVALIVVVVPALVAVIFVALFVNLRRQRGFISRRTYRMHKNLICMLGLQVSLARRRGRSSV